MPITRQEFNACISQGMSGKHFTKEQRKLEFCVTAKMCAKHLDRAEAVRLCSLPKPPKPEGTGKRRSKKGAECPEFDKMSLMPYCEKKLATVVKSGELPSDTDVTGICQLILG